MASSEAEHARTQPRRHVRKQPRYLDPDTDTDDDNDSTAQVTRPARSSRHVQSYREHSDSSGTENESTSSSSIVPATSPVRPGGSQRNVVASKRKRSARSTYNQNTFMSYKKKKFAQPLVHHGKNASQPPLINFPVRKKVPAWQTLEYQIWVKILDYAARPVLDHSGRCNASVSWLLQMSRLCRAFNEAALAVLTWSPPLLPSYRAHGLIDLLSQDAGELTMNYSTKIHALDIEVKQLLTSKSGINLKSLISRTPLLKHLRIFHPNDDLMGKFIWAKPVFGRDKWTHGDLFNILDEHEIRLKSFEWNGRFRDTIEAMLNSSTKPCLSTVQNLTLINFAIEDRDDGRRTGTRDCCISSITALKLLKTLKLVNCNIINAEFMQNSPTSLSELVITNCQSLTSDALQNYLSQAGTSILKLHLTGNQIMDLGFTSNLRESCPNLQDLLIDLTYEDSSSYHDRDPLYDHLLPLGPPTWPSTLQIIVIGPLRSLSVSDAEEFYQSLIDAALTLPYLRTINLKTLLKDASWRDRARLRAKWAAIFDHVFLSSTIQPKTKDIPDEVEAHVQRKDPSKRKSSRIQRIEDVKSSESAKLQDVDAAFEDLPQHNRCDVVMFELSDQRPAQEQYREEDFLDDELSGDEEWRE